MRGQFSLLVALSLVSRSLSSYPHSYHTHNYYVLEHNPAGSASLDEVVGILGVEVIDKVGELDDHWLVRTPKPLDARGEELGQNHDHVLGKYQSLRAQARRRSSTNLSIRSGDEEIAKRFDSSVKDLARQQLRQRVKRAPPPPIQQDESDTTARGVAERFGIQDPLFEAQWHLVNEDFPENSMNITSVWEMGITGKGVLSSLVDDGLDYTSEDLKDNFNAEASYDFNDHTDLPTPKLFDDHHGTRCAGQIAAGKNNACGIGIAYNSKVAGVRILSGPISDVDESAALNYGFQDVSIYSCSWGPPDNGQAMEGPSQLIKKAVLNGINKGRGGKGSIFVFASGNGAHRGDQCNFDGYTNSIYSVTVSAVDYKGLHPYYSEACAANMVTAYSSGSGKHIVTTDKGRNSCSKSHGGTSAAAPNAAGILALAMEARPELTWRDVQHLCVQTSQLINPDDPDWERTAQGRLYSYKYGFGVIDAGKLVEAAKDWKLVKPQAWLKTHTIVLNNGVMTADQKFSGGEFIKQTDAPRSEDERSDPNSGVKSVMTITKEMVEAANFEKLEHIQVKVWIQHARRGDVEVEIVSPAGVMSMLGGRRKDDADETGYPGWTFMSVKHWDEDLVGDWTIRVSDQSIPGLNGSFLGWNMMFWGSVIDPEKATLYQLPEEDTVFPPHEDPPAMPTATVTRVPTKPTAHLPEDHGEAEGENTKPAFPSHTPVTTGTPAPEDVGWFSGMSNLSKNNKWVGGAIAVVVLFGVGVAIFFWRRRVGSQKRKQEYESLAGEEDVLMSSVERGGATGRDSGSGIRSGRGTTRELYDAFGEVSDDDEGAADEETRLRPDRSNDVSLGIGYHSGFLDDEDETESRSGYRDEPEGQNREDL